MAATNSIKRPGLAMIANCMTPYRANLHAMIAAGIPELKLHTLITHGAADFDWTMTVPASINVSNFAGMRDGALAGPFASPWQEWRKAKRIIEYIHEHDIRAVILMGYRYLSFLRIIQHGYRNNIPVFSNNDSNIRSDERLSWRQRCIKKRIYDWWIPRVAGVMSMGEYGDQFFLKYGVQRDRLYRLPYTPDYDYYANIDIDQLNAFRGKFGLDPANKYLLYSGRLVPVKRVDLVLDAYAAISEERPNWDLLVVGDGPLRRELMDRVPNKLRSRVIWTGFLEQSESIAAYHAANLLVLASDHEPWALVVQEAMAAGLGVVASDVVGAAREMIEDNVNGRIFSAGDLPALTQALRDTTQPERIREIQNSSRLALANWRSRVDPVAEVRRALRDVGALPPDTHK